MRVLQITRDFPPHSTGGISSAVGGLVDALISAGIEVLVLSFDGWRPVSKPNEDSDSSYEEYGEVRVWRVSSPPQVESALRKIGAACPEVLHVHHGMLWQTCDAFETLPKIFTAHVLQRELNRQRGTSRSTMSLRGQELALGAADVVIAPSEAAHGILAKDYPDLAGRLCRIGFAVRAAVAVKKRSQFQYKTHYPSALYSGRFSDVKGTAELLAAVPKILDAVPDAEIVIAGGNPESPASDRRWRRRFNESVREEQRNRLQLVGWKTAHELAEHYSAAWVQLSPSWFETFGLAALEAMAYGSGVIATTGGALPELVIDGETGLLSPTRDIEAFVANAIMVLQDRELAFRLGRAAAERASRDFLWSEVARKHFEAYENCLR